jgi:hypothetical protein
MVLDLFVASEAARKLVKDSLEPARSPAPKAKRERRRRVAVRSSSAAALRSLADRLEPSPSA